MLEFEQEVHARACQRIDATNEAKAPEPCQTVTQDKGIQWSVKTSVFHENTLTCLIEVRLALDACEAPDLHGVWHVQDVSKPDCNEHVSRGLVDEVRNKEDVARHIIGRNFTPEAWFQASPCLGDLFG